MVTVRVIQVFYFGKLDEIKNLKRANLNNNREGYFNVGDIFECSSEIADYLAGKNMYNGTKLKEAYVEILDVMPENTIKEEPKEEVKKTTRRRKRSLAKD